MDILEDQIPTLIKWQWTEGNPMLITAKKTAPAGPLESLWLSWVSVVLLLVRLGRLVPARSIIVSFIGDSVPSSIATTNPENKMNNSLIPLKNCKDTQR